MDLELTDEQCWLSESVDTLLGREWLAPELVRQADGQRRGRVWAELVDFGALSVGAPDGIGAVEACLIARSLGAHLASAPFLASAALRLALAPLGDELGPDLARVAGGGAAVALGVLERGGSWAAEPGSVVRDAGHGPQLRGEKVGIEQLDMADVLAIAAVQRGEPALVLVDPRAAGVIATRRETIDPTVPMSAARFADVPLGSPAILAGPGARDALQRLGIAGALLAAAEAVGAAGQILDDACRYAAQRRQFGRRIVGFQALRHLLADMYVASASGWSSVLYAAAAFDDGSADFVQAASVAKAYVSRAAREVAHDAMQVFGGIAFTDEHPAHLFLRRIILREQQFGDAGHHERALGAALAQATSAPTAAVLA